MITSLMRNGILSQLSRPASLLATLAAVLLASGCGDSARGRCAISGTVTFHGKPLDQGSILFISASGDSPTQSGAGITDGNFAIPNTQGLVPGKYKVSISSADGQTPDGPTDALPGPSGNFSSKERIPREFNIDSKLEIEVEKNGPNTFTFQIP